MDPSLIEWVWDEDGEVEQHMWDEHETCADDVYDVCYDDEAVHVENDGTATWIMIGLTPDKVLHAVPYDRLPGPGLRFRARSCYPVHREDLISLYWTLRDQRDKEAW